MEEFKNNNQYLGRDYDKNPIKITNYSVLFESYFVALIVLVGIPLAFNDLYYGFLGQEKFNIITVVIFIFMIYEIYVLLIDYPKKFKEKPSFFTFNQNTIQYHHIYLQKIKDDLNLMVNINNINKISRCIVCELPESYGRWHYLTSWQLYRKSSIGVHIGKATLFIRYLITYILFILPYKIYRLLKAKESLGLLSKNLFIQFDNRNYFLVNIYSQKELDELIEYFKTHNIQITNKTYFIPHLQNQGWFVDKEEVWTDDFNNTK